jgi:hypothetical protein
LNLVVVQQDGGQDDSVCRAISACVVLTAKGMAEVKDIETKAVMYP